MAEEAPILTLSQAYQAGLREEMERDESIVVMGTDLFDRGGHWAQVKGLGEQFGRERIRDTPISEAAMIAAGVGAALYGLRPVVDLNFIDFVFGGMDEVVNQASKIRYMWGVDVPIVIRATAGVAFGGPQHNNSVESWFAHMPGLLVAYPASPADTKGLIKSALRGRDPVIFLMHKSLSGMKGRVGGPDEVVPFGHASVVRPGSDVTIVAYAAPVHHALKAAEELTSIGVDAEVIDLRTVYPIDYATVERSVRKTGRLVVLSEAPVACSVVTDVASRIQERAFGALCAPIRLLGAKHAPIPHSPPMFRALIPQIADIAASALELVNHWPRPSDHQMAEATR